MFHYGDSSYCVLFQNKDRLIRVAKAFAQNDQSKNPALYSPSAFV